MPHLPLRTTAFVAAMFAATAAQPQCTVDAAPSPSYLRQVAKLESKLKSNPQALAAFRDTRVLANNSVWVCNKETKDTCCVDIPVKVTPLIGGPTKCDALVTFPYHELKIERDGGRFKPKISWKLDPQGVGPHHFGSSGIEVLRPGSAWPVETSGPEKCRYDGTIDSFRCKGNGRRYGRADHQANVYPQGHLDDAMYRCLDVDPLIHNVD